MTGFPQKIVSGGQTGVDRAALDAALALGVPCGGRCPKGRRAEDGVIDARYPLTETASDDYGERTRLNVEEADATLILNRGPLEGGTLMTRDLARELEKPHLVDDLDDASVDAAAEWILRVRPGALNVAGPRESKSPGVYASARAFLAKLLAITRPS